ncbi:MAG: LysM domain-containing protein [Vulcanimicrobiaceae bacterium]
MFPPNSRYQTVGTDTYTTPAGKTIVYLQRRFIPSPDQFATIQTYSVKQGDRIDNISAQAFGDPELYWRICDANLALRPADLTATIGANLRITLPQGIPATPSA